MPPQTGAVGSDVHRWGPNPSFSVQSHIVSRRVHRCCGCCGQERFLLVRRIVVLWTNCGQCSCPGRQPTSRRRYATPAFLVVHMPASGTGRLSTIPSPGCAYDSLGLRRACLLLDAVGQLADLVVDVATLGHLLANLAIGVHHRGVVTAAELLADLRQGQLG